MHRLLKCRDVGGRFWSRNAVDDTADAIGRTAEVFIPWVRARCEECGDARILGRVDCL